MTITLVRSADRTYDSRRNGERWTTFPPGNQNDLRFGPHLLDSLVEYDLAPGMGLLIRARQDNEMVTYVEEGALTQEDAIGRTAHQQAGAFRHDSTPGGTIHTAYNESRTEHAHVFQSGISSSHDPLKPGGQQKLFSRSERTGCLRLIASADGKEGSLRLAVDARVFSSLLRKGTHLIHELLTGRRGWLQLVAGQVQLREHVLNGGDGAALVDEIAISFTARIPSEILLFDLP